MLFLLGGFGEQVLLPARIVEKSLHRLPSGLDVGLAPLAEPLACAIHAVRDVALRPGESVAILGAGSLGLMLCGLTAEAGARPIVLDPHEERLERARRFGALLTLRADRSEQDVSLLREVTGGRGAEVVFEAVGRTLAWELAVQMAAPGATVNLFGGCPGASEFTVATARVHYEEVTLTGSFHHAHRYIASALETLARAERPWAELLGPLIGLEELPRALAGELGNAPKFTVRPNGS
jgi:L-iditol 2-dehydrogenase